MSNQLVMQSKDVRAYIVSDKELVNWLCIRICHDLLNPAGALQIVTDGLEADDREGISLIKDATHNLINVLDLLRKAYGYQAEFLQTSQVRKLIEDTFNTQISIDPGVNVNWWIDLLRLLVWLKYKILEESKINITAHDEEVEVEVSGIYLTAEEEGFFQLKPIEWNAYSVYLLLFVLHLSEEKGVSFNWNNEILKIRLLRLK